MAEGKVIIMDATRFGLRATGRFRLRRPIPPAITRRTATNARHSPSFSKAWRMGKALSCLTGAPASAKTLLIHCLLERLGSGYGDSVSDSNRSLPRPAGLLQSILYDLSLPYEGRGEQEMRWP